MFFAPIWRRLVPTLLRARVQLLKNSFDFETPALNRFWSPTSAYRHRRGPFAPPLECLDMLSPPLPACLDSSE